MNNDYIENLTAKFAAALKQADVPSATRGFVDQNKNVVPSYPTSGFGPFQGVYGFPGFTPGRFASDLLQYGPTAAIARDGHLANPDASLGGYVPGLIDMGAAAAVGGLAGRAAQTGYRALKHQAVPLTQPIGSMGMEDLNKYLTDRGVADTGLTVYPEGGNPVAPGKGKPNPILGSRAGLAEYMQLTQAHGYITPAEFEEFKAGSGKGMYRSFDDYIASKYGPSAAPGTTLPVSASPLDKSKRFRAAQMQRARAVPMTAAGATPRVTVKQPTENPAKAKIKPNSTTTLRPERSVLKQPQGKWPFLLPAGLAAGGYLADQYFNSGQLFPDEIPFTTEESGAIDRRSVDRINRETGGDLTPVDDQRKPLSRRLDFRYQ